MLSTIIKRLDILASKIEQVNPRIALAIDQISDRLEASADSYYVELLEPIIESVLKKYPSFEYSSQSDEEDPSEGMRDYPSAFVKIEIKKNNEENTKYPPKYFTITARFDAADGSISRTTIECHYDGENKSLPALNKNFSENITDHTDAKELVEKISRKWFEAVMIEIKKFVDKATN